MSLSFNPNRFLDVDITQQSLTVFDQGESIKCYLVSTAKNGPGEQMGSECTPTGWHQVRVRIGEGLPLNSVFVGRRPTGEIYSTHLAKQAPERVWVLTRILWLGGLELGKNRYGQVDSTWRYIYIHGTSDEKRIGQPVSAGCIRMKNEDVIELFDEALVDDIVLIR